jgi:hypothetical protein
MKISERATGLAWIISLAIVLLSPPIRAADVVTLDSSESRLSGKVRAIDAAGVLELESPLSPQPLRIKAGQFRKAEFDASTAQEGGVTGTLLELANGDLLPVSVESFDRDMLVAHSPMAGRLEVRREVISALQLGIGSPRVVFRGPGRAGDWSGTSEEMRIDGEEITATGAASAARGLDLPERFVLRFTLKWQNGQSPSFIVFFADPLKGKHERSDRYRFVFNSGGIEIKRLTAAGGQHRSLLQLNRRPDQFHERQLQVEIRVDRKASQLQLFLDGLPENPVVDPVQPPPSGSGLVFECNASDRSPHTIRQIEILELQDNGVRHRSEERGDAKEDGLVSRDEDRWNGRLVDVRKAGDEMVYRFKTTTQDDPLEIPAAEVSTVFFASGIAKDAAPAVTPFLLRLVGGGRLHVGSCTFDGAGTTVRHPLLGDLKLDRGSIVSLERSAAPAPKADPAAPKSKENPTGGNDR